ncbi:unnamed protein product [Lasius platythorax]|uniref:Uncharacterized protein n=1 Tax=Lasius platythorax TaxID=488582 RepID=A0AAV2NK44_9HYME
MHFPEYTVSRRGKCIQPAGACGNIHRFAPETHARSRKQRTVGVESFLHCGVCFFRVRTPMTPTTITENGQEDEDEGRAAEGRSPPSPPTRRRTREVSGKVTPRHLARENIAGYPSWTLIKRGLRGVCSSLRPVTLGHSRVNGTRRSSLASSSVIRRASYGVAHCRSLFWQFTFNTSPGAAIIARLPFANCTCTSLHARIRLYKRTIVRDSLSRLNIAAACVALRNSDSPVRASLLRGWLYRPIPFVEL